MGGSPLNRPPRTSSRTDGHHRGIQKEPREKEGEAVLHGRPATFVHPALLHQRSKEYVAAQDPGDPGVLVLSQFAGVVHELEQALIVNPYDVQAISEAVDQALRMPLAERRERCST